MKRIAVMLALLMLWTVPMGAVSLAEDTNDFTQWLDGAQDSVETWLRASGEIEVRGQAVRTVAPDTVKVRVGATVERETEREAQQEANRIINEVIAALKELGVEESDMMTSGYNVTRKYRYIGRTQVADGYVARITLQVTSKDFDRINQVLDIAVEKGANDVGGITFSHSDEGAVYRQALGDAVAAAKAKAEIMADAVGVQLISLISLREGNTYSGAVYNSYEPMAEMAASDEGGSAQVMAGEMEVSAQVTLVYRVK